MLGEGVSSPASIRPAARPKEPPPGSNDGDGSGIEAAGGSKLIGRTGGKGGSSGIGYARATDLEFRM